MHLKSDRMRTKVHLKSDGMRTKVTSFSNLVMQKRLSP